MWGLSNAPAIPGVRAIRDDYLGRRETLVVEPGLSFVLERVLITQKAAVSSQV